MKYVYGSGLLIFLILAADLAHAHFTDWRKERKRQANMRKFNIAAFRGTRQTDWWAK